MHCAEKTANRIYTPAGVVVVVVKKKTTLFFMTTVILVLKTNNVKPVLHHINYTTKQHRKEEANATAYNEQVPYSMRILHPAPQIEYYAQ